MLRFLTGGESHGPALVSILDGVPAGLPFSLDVINEELWRRQQGYGRGNRQKIEKDEVQVLGGVRHGITTGAPLALLIANRDFENWQHVMSVLPVDKSKAEVMEQLEKKAISRFRPGHADLSGTFKYRQSDIRDVLERASARETACRVAGGAVARQILNYLGVSVVSYVVQIGTIKSKIENAAVGLSDLETESLNSELFCPDKEATEQMKSLIKEAWQAGDSLGGVVEILADGLPVGLGSYTQWDRRLDGLLGQALLSIQAIKAVEIGDGILAAAAHGSDVHDALYPNEHSSGLPFARKTNRAGGLEGGMTNGSRLWLRAYMKPIPTIRQGLESLNFPGLAADRAHYERSDVCAIAAASVVCKAMVCLVLANAVLDKFGGDNILDLKQAFEEYQKFCHSPNFANANANTDQLAESSDLSLEPQGNEDAVGEF